jgi:hypothetical protein
MVKRGRPKNPDSSVKRRVVQIRLSEAEKQDFSDAAKFSGLPLSSWARERLKKAARDELRKAKKDGDFFF